MVRLAAIKCPHVGRTEVGLKLRWSSGRLDVGLYWELSYLFVLFVKGNLYIDIYWPWLGRITCQWSWMFIGNQEDSVFPRVSAKIRVRAQGCDGRCCIGQSAFGENRRSCGFRWSWKVSTVSRLRCSYRTNDCLQAGLQAVLQIFQNLATFQGQTKGWQCIFSCVFITEISVIPPKKGERHHRMCSVFWANETIQVYHSLTQGFLVFCFGWICDACHLKSRACHAMAETLRFPNLPPNNFIIATRFTAVFDSTSTGPVSVLRDARMPQSWTSLQTSQDN